MLLSLLDGGGRTMIYGYARVSTTRQAKDGNSLEAQEKELKANGATMIYADSFTGTKTDRPKLTELLDNLEKGDTIVCTKLDRVARSASQGIKLVDDLLAKGVNVHILNMGLLDNSSTGKLVRNIMFAFAEFERDMIVQRTQEGRAIAREKWIAEGETPRDRRPKKFTKKQLDHAMELRKQGYSFSQVAEMTGISRATLTRESDRRKAEQIKAEREQEQKK